MESAWATSEPTVRRSNAVTSTSTSTTFSLVSTRTRMMKLGQWWADRWKASGRPAPDWQGAGGPDLTNGVAAGGGVGQGMTGPRPRERGTPQLVGRRQASTPLRARLERRRFSLT